MRQCEKCSNHRYIIIDTNVFISLGKYSVNSVKIDEFNKFKALFLDQLAKLKICSLDNQLHVPNQLYRSEINPGTKKSTFRYNKEDGWPWVQMI